jgi:hypothetical protein
MNSSFCRYSLYSIALFLEAQSASWVTGECIACYPRYLSNTSLFTKQAQCIKALFWIIVAPTPGHFPDMKGERVKRALYRSNR